MNVIWGSDTKKIVELGVADEDPRVWNIRHQVLALKAKFNNYCWKLEWCSREANRLAYRIAKFAFVCKVNLSFNLMSMNSYPLHLIRLLTGKLIPCFR